MRMNACFIFPLHWVDLWNRQSTYCCTYWWWPGRTKLWL